MGEGYAAVNACYASSNMSNFFLGPRRNFRVWDRPEPVVAADQPVGRERPRRGGGE